MSAGELFFINSGELHELKAGEHSLHHAVVFNPRLLDFSLYDSCQHYFIEPVTQKRMLFPTHVSALLSPDNRSRLRRIFTTIVEEYHYPQPCSSLDIKACLLRILSLCYQDNLMLPNEVTGRQLSSMKQLKAVIDFIHNHCGEQITLEQLAETACMNPTYFCRYFRQETGRTPFSFLNEYRMKTAATLLADDSMSVSETAACCGFDNVSYFIRRFREYHGMTPGRYQKTRR